MPPGPEGSVNDPTLLTTAKNDLTTAFTNAAGQPTTGTFNAGDNQLGGQTLTAGVYAFGHASHRQHHRRKPPRAQRSGWTRTRCSSSRPPRTWSLPRLGSVVRLENSAQACNVFWVVGNSSTTLGSSSTFVGTMMALTSATLDSTATVQGQFLARNGAVTLDHNTIVAPTSCAVAPTTTTTTASTTGSTTAYDRCRWIGWRRRHQRVGRERIDGRRIGNGNGNRQRRDPHRLPAHRRGRGVALPQHQTDRAGSPGAGRLRYLGGHRCPPSNTAGQVSLLRTTE